MNKLAIFVEGQTEQIFVERLLNAIAGENNIKIESSKRFAQFSALKLASEQTPGQERYYVQIYDSSNDSKVVSDVRDHYDRLVASGYQAIIGIRDVYPTQREDISKLRIGCISQLKSKPIKVCFILAVMEIEAWFLAEFTHFERIDPRLSMEYIGNNLGFDPQTDDMSIRLKPSDDLHNIYQLVNKAYHKSKKQVQGTVKALDYAHLYLELISKIEGLSRLIDEIDHFLGLPKALLPTD